MKEDKIIEYGKCDNCVENKTIEDTLKKFDEQYENSSLFYCYDGCRESLRDFIKEAIKLAMDEMTPKLIEIDKEVSTDYVAGMKRVIDQLEQNKAEFLNN